MKKIDLLNKIANGELEDGTNIKLLEHNTDIIYRKNSNSFEFVNKGEWNDYFDQFSLDELNDEIEIIEEPKELEKITWNEKSKYKDWTTSDFDRMLMNRTEQLKKGLNKLIEKKYKVSLKKDSWEECIPKKIENIHFSVYDYQRADEYLRKIEDKFNQIIDKLNEVDVNE